MHTWFDFLCRRNSWIRDHPNPSRSRDNAHPARSRSTSQPERGSAPFCSHPGTRVREWRIPGATIAAGLAPCVRVIVQFEPDHHRQRAGLRERPEVSPNLTVRYIVGGTLTKFYLNQYVTSGPWWPILFSSVIFWGNQTRHFVVILKIFWPRGWKWSSRLPKPRTGGIHTLCCLGHTTKNKKRYYRNNV